MLPSITIFGKTIGMYAVCAVVGLLACGFILSYIGKKKRGISHLDIILAMLSITIGLLVGGHLLYAVTRYEVVIEAFSMIGSAPFSEVFSKFNEGFGGSVFYGGLIGGGFGLWIFTKIEKGTSVREFFDLYAVGIPLFHCFGRIGCFFGGCCYGVESSFGYIIYNNEFAEGVNGVRRFPIQLTEALLNLILFFVMLMVYKKAKTCGHLIFLYMMIYPVYRFILEFFRGDEIRRHWFGLSTSQWISIILLVIGIVGMIIISRFDKNSQTKKVKTLG